MRIALISDIHGNLTALEAALSDIADRKADRTICLGDVAALGPQPREVISLLNDCSIPVVMGNTDQWLLNPEPWPAEDEATRRQIAIELWAAEQLDDGDRERIAGYAPLLPFDLGGGFTLLCYHGSPRSFNDAVRPTTPEEDLDAWFPESRALVMAGGHTHEPMVRRYGESMLVNPGSIGLPVLWPASGEGESRPFNPAWAEYAEVTWDAGALSIALRRVPYPIDTLAAAVRASAMPYASHWLADWRSPDKVAAA